MRLYSATAEDGFCQLSTDANRSGAGSNVLPASSSKISTAQAGRPSRPAPELPGTTCSASMIEGGSWICGTMSASPGLPFCTMMPSPALHSRLLDTAAVELQGPVSRAVGQALTGARAQDAVVDFVKQNAAALPRYAVPISA